MAGNVPNNVLTQKLFRTFVQFGGASPLNNLQLAGKDLGYSRLSGVTRNIRGGIDNIPVYQPDGQGYQNVGSMGSAPGYDTAELGVWDLIGGINQLATIETCPLTVYELSGNECNSLSDHLQGYAQSSVLVLPDAVVTDSISRGDLGAYADDNAIERTVPLTIRGKQFEHGQKFFGALATANPADLATNLTTGVAYGNSTICANCGYPNDGTAFKYWSLASTTASPGAKPTIVYQIRGGTPVAMQVTSAAIAEDLTFIETVGNYLVVGSATAGGAGIGGYHYALIGKSGIPGTWTKVVTGFQANKQPTDILAFGPNEIYFSANGGYIYKSTNLTAGVSVLNAGATTTNNLGRIQGNSTLMVAVGATGTIIYSNNRGNSWSSVPTTPAAGTPTWASVDVVGQGIWVGSTTTGRLFYSPDTGSTWVEVSFDNNGGAGTISDIYFVNANEGYYLFNPTVGSGRIYNTFTGGASWLNTSPAVEGLGSYVSLTRIAAPTTGNETIKANNAIVAGNSTGTVGLLLSAAPNYV